MQRLDVDNDFNAICNLFTDFDPILALDFASLDYFKDFVSADNIGVCKAGFILNTPINSSASKKRMSLILSRLNFVKS